MNDQISSLLSKEDCKKILYRFCNIPIEIHKYRISKLSEKVLGFLGEHYQLRIIYSLKDDTRKQHETTFFLKSMPLSNERQNKYITAMGIFKKEISVYKNLISTLIKYTTKPFCAQCYFTKSDSCIVLEDLSLKSFKVIDDIYINLDQCKAALQTIARFHSSSLIFEEIRSTAEVVYRIEDHYPEEITESTFSFVKDHPRNKWAITATDCLMNLSKYFKGNNEIAEKINNYVFKQMPILLKPSKIYRNVVTHDDLWKNNLMFNNKNECLLVDFQLTRYTPPILDVLLFLYINLQRNVLESNFDSLLNFYYSSMERELIYHQLDPEKVLSKNEFFESVKLYTLPALIEACMYGTNTFLPEDVSLRVISNMEVFEEFTFKNRSPFIIKEYEKNESFRDRFSDILIPLFHHLEKL